MTTEGTEPQHPRQRRRAQPRHRRDKTDRRVKAVTIDGRRRLDRVVKGCRVLAPECVRARRDAVVEIALGRSRSRGGSDRDQLLGWT
ncbi:MAG TPA: hypothetical protein VHW96_10725 [Solirubrobacteraceae bacterium]|jgi:hypothetical protein|nr:hypothetical protein [Solirubrobacteraceae bacterium]